MRIIATVAAATAATATAAVILTTSGLSAGNTSETNTIRSARPVQRTDVPKQPKVVPTPEPERKHPAPTGFDDYVGWYKIAGTDTYVPVIKNPDGHYYTVARGMEVRLDETTDGLTWRIGGSSLNGTTISYDEETQQYTIALFDSGNQSEEYEQGRKHRLIRVEKPEGLSDAVAPAPRSMDDFVGWYELLYLPCVRIEVTKNGDKLFVISQMIDEGGKWRASGEKAQLRVLPDQSGFEVKPNQSTLTYNRSHQRYEVPLGTDGKVGMPLKQLDSSPPAEVRDPRKMPRIGIPEWT